MRHRFRTSIDLKALAKINLGLDVLGRRPDGYHDVRMIMQSVYLYDEIRIERTRALGIELETNLYFLPRNERNIAYRAAAMLAEEFKLKEGIHITLNKHIPVCAGMGGGSSDAAAVLYGMNTLFCLGLSRKGLMNRGLKLGADVPYCIMRGTALAEGIGERLTALSPMPKCNVLIAKPPVNISTKDVYEALDSKEIAEHPDIDTLIRELEKKDLHRIAGAMGNVLETVTIPLCPVIAEIKELMRSEGALGAMMSGSGPTVFGLFESQAEARRARDKIREKTQTRQVYVTYIHGSGGKGYGT